MVDNVTDMWSITGVYVWNSEDQVSDLEEYVSTVQEPSRY
jgi:hypothetical protein